MNIYESLILHCANFEQYDTTEVTIISSQILQKIAKTRNILHLKSGLQNHPKLICNTETCDTSSVDMYIL